MTGTMTLALSDDSAVVVMMTCSPVSRRVMTIMLTKRSRKGGMLMARSLEVMDWRSWGRRVMDWRRRWMDRESFSCKKR